MKEQLAKAFQAYLAGNHTWPEGTAASYGITVEDVYPNGRPPSGEEVCLEFRFCRGMSYCCTELGCHLNFFHATDWLRLRQLMGEESVGLGHPMSIRARVVIEVGAIDNGILNTKGREYCYDVFHEPGPDEPLRRGDCGTPQRN